MIRLTRPAAKPLRWAAGNATQPSAVTIPEAFLIGHQQHQAGRLAEAEAIYRQILAVDPRHADAMHLLGVLAGQAGRHDAAADLIGKAVALAPHFALAHFNLATALNEGGRRDAAIAACRRTLELQPGHAEAHFLLGTLLMKKEQPAEAAAAYRRTLELKPDYAEAHNNLSVALRDQGHDDEAMAACRRAIQIKPDYALAHFNVGNALRDQNNTDEAMAAYRRALEIQPDLPAVKWNYSQLLLLRGDFERGWPLYEARLDARIHGASKIFGASQGGFHQPVWGGGPLDGRRILLRAEQGFGDTLQFVRYAPLVAQRGGRVILECQPGLKSLLTSVENVSQIIERGEPLPALDLHCPMMSLPLAFGTRLATIPAGIPYLRADARKAAQWRGRLEQRENSLGKGNAPQRRALKIGLVWAGSTRPDQPTATALDRRRSIALSRLAPLAAVPGTLFVSLQKGASAKQAQTPPEGMALADWTDELHDFSDTAALVEALDLVISVDTAVAHLAGALGKPVWLLNRFDTCWRWMLERGDSPWYPTLRQFRQPGFMEWDPVIAEVRGQLERLAKLHRESGEALLPRQC